ncbi:Rab guanine nucleotide exchange factor sec2 [Wickerhamiella sorbophila]|uniref:Rab guanine nucleotide exchange factor sec2 n=1 Tax=Wickerhamiella sorbophila TaxID=45607 RepID=A0A2T0FI16_9ASCO|nr:Rab guanine nucleotide exchange factor sec2 [Wickerhamiella sorbophila]PRT54642.1 Rab guanine nucleotide exchange factor sec2 [Wickerhamiella sorbophila]
MEDVQRISAQLSEALNQAADQDVELRRLRRALEQAQLEAAEVVKAKEELTKEREKLAADLAAAQEAKLRADNELADLSSGLLADAGEKVREANVRAAEAEQRAKDIDARRARQIAEMEENHAQQVAVLQAMIAAEAESDAAAAPETKVDNYITHIPSFGTREVDLTDNDDFAEALEAAQWTSPLRPTARTDLPDFKDFMALAGTAASLQQQKDSFLAPFQRSSTPRMPHLSTIRFAARTIAEDVEPTLRLDSAVHLSWLVRRAWYGAVVDGTLLIEPVSTALRAWATRPSNPCCLCGEARTTPQYARLYSVKLPKDPTDYILGLECVVRVRAACEYIAFLRSLRDGVRKVDTLEAALAAWQECLKLREEMFWSRSSGFFAMKREAVDRAYVPPTPRVNESPSSLPENLETPILPQLGDKSGNLDEGEPEEEHTQGEPADPRGGRLAADALGISNGTKHKDQDAQSAREGSPVGSHGTSRSPADVDGDAVSESSASMRSAHSSYDAE